MFGPVVIKTSDRDAFLSRQGRLRLYLDPLTHPETRSITDGCSPMNSGRNPAVTATGEALRSTSWTVSVTRSSKASASNGKRAISCSKPMKPDGVERQHFNLDPAKPSHWTSFVPIPLIEHVASQITQTEASPEFPQR
jgi:hypothetical protein